VARHSPFAIALSWALAATLLAVPALADIAPADACQAADEGKACENANADGKMDQPGSCQKATCSRATPNGNMSYDCYLCKAAEAKKDDGNCSTSGSRKNAAWAAAPLLLLGLLWNRRRKSGAS
jgi:MYXO-CTERM domain-containing protein